MSAVFSSVGKTGTGLEQTCTGARAARTSSDIIAREMVATIDGKWEVIIMVSDVKCGVGKGGRSVGMSIGKERNESREKEVKSPIFMIGHGCNK